MYKLQLGKKLTLELTPGQLIDLFEQITKIISTELYPEMIRLQVELSTKEKSERNLKFHPLSMGNPGESL